MLRVELVPDVERHCRPRLLHPRVLGVDPCIYGATSLDTGTKWRRLVPPPQFPTLWLAARLVRRVLTVVDPCDAHSSRLVPTDYL